MTRARSSRSLAYAVSFPLMAAGSLAAHSLAYRAVAGDGDERLELLEHSGHGFLAYAHLAKALLASGEVIGRALAGHRRRHFAATPAPSRRRSSDVRSPISVLALGHSQRAPPLH